MMHNALLPLPLPLLGAFGFGYTGAGLALELVNVTIIVYLTNHQIKGEWGQGIQTVTGIGPLEYGSAINSLAILCWHDMDEQAIRKSSIYDLPPLPSGEE